MRLGREIDRSHPSSAEVKNERSCTFSPPVCLRGMDRDITLRDCHVLAYFGSASLVDTLLSFLLIMDPKERGDRGSTMVKVLCYKSEGSWFDPSWCQWIFH